MFSSTARRTGLLSRIARRFRREERGAILVDVRLPEEYLRGHLEGAVNLPLRRLRSEARAMDSSRPLVVYCDTGRRSAAASFLLSERGFDARWIERGVPETRFISHQEFRLPPA